MLYHCLGGLIQQHEKLFSVKKIKEFLGNKWLRFSFSALIYILMVIWIENYWLFLGLPIVFDVYISKKVRWAFWKKWEYDANGKKRRSIEWLDAIIFAVVAATLIRTFFVEAYTIPTGSMEKELLVGDYLFVSKYHYGPRLPNTPLSLPFMHHTVPVLNTKSYSSIPNLDYKRIAGLQEIERGDIVVFNLPVGDTVMEEFQSEFTYYQALRVHGREVVERRNDLITRPVDKRENYVKRCVAIQGDTLELIDGEVYINGEFNDNYPNRQKKYRVKTSGDYLDPYKKERIFRSVNLSPADVAHLRTKNGRYIGTESDMHMRKADADKARSLKYFEYVDMVMAQKGARNPHVFPHSPDYNWNQDQFGPLVVPARGMTMKLDMKNIALYERAIRVYEENKLEKKNGKIYINDVETDEYTFKMNYYWMMGDNRDNSQDARFWGFVPEDHIVGTPVLIWMSSDSQGWGGIRWDRLFTIVD